MFHKQDAHEQHWLSEKSHSEKPLSRGGEHAFHEVHEHWRSQSSGGHSHNHNHSAGEISKYGFPKLELEHGSHHGSHHGNHDGGHSDGSQSKGGFVPASNRDAMIVQALRLAGHKATPEEVRNARALVNQESSFKADAINLRDWNARHRIPSKGWAQTTDPTFKANHVPGHENIWNPVDNLAAGIKYADRRYGHLDPGHNGLRWVAINRSLRHLGY
jgi:hypothetical protein